MFAWIVIKHCLKAQAIGGEIMNMLLTNNSRRMAGLAPYRKGFKGRDKNMEVISAFLDYCDGRRERKCKKS